MLYSWTAKSGELDAPNAKWLRTLEENGKLKRLLANAMHWMLLRSGSF